MTVPDAANSASRPLDAVAPNRTDAVEPVASAICEAMVRFQINSYSRYSSLESVPRTASGVRNVSPAGRIASCASCAFLLLEAYVRGAEGTYSVP